MSVQKYETDVLQEHIDSTPILITRLEQWSKGVHLVQEYIRGYLQVHQGISHDLEKTLKSVSDEPGFPDLSRGATDATGGTPPPSLGNVFHGLQQNVNLLLQRSTATANGIRNTILPSLDQIVDEIDKHYKTLRSQGSRGMKEIEKSREHTQRNIEHLGKVTSSFGARTLSPSDDPYLLHRRVESAVVDQVERENTQAEAALNVQKSFASLETHIVQTIRHSLATLASLNEGYDNSDREVNAAITNSFKQVDLDKEWTAFTQSNKDNLVPSTNFQRDPRNVTFVNKNHASAQPLIQGTLNRKGTVLKNYSPGYYVVTPSGYMFQFKGVEPDLDATPELSLFLPDCQISKSSQPGEYVFRIVGKDSHKAISTRHKYTFKTNSQRELETWYGAIARVTGNEAEYDDSPSEAGGVASAASTPAQSPPRSPQEPPTSQLANTTIDERTANPQTAAAAAALQQSGSSTPQQQAAAFVPVQQTAIPQRQASPFAPAQPTSYQRQPAAFAPAQQANVAPQHVAPGTQGIASQYVQSPTTAQSAAQQVPRPGSPPLSQYGDSVPVQQPGVPGGRTSDIPDNDPFRSF